MVGASAPRAEHIWAQGEPQGCGCPSTAASSDLQWDCMAPVLPRVPSLTSLLSTSSCVCPLRHHTDTPACLVVREQNCQKHINLLSELNFLLFWMKISFLARDSTSNRAEPGCGVQGGDGPQRSCLRLLWTVCSLKCLTSAQSTTRSVSYGLRLSPAPNLAFLAAHISCRGSRGTTGRGSFCQASLQLCCSSLLNHKWICVISVSCV